MASSWLTFQVACRGKNPCIFEGHDLFLNIRVTNSQILDVGFPLDYCQKKGPDIRLIDRKTQATSDLRNNPSNPELKKKLTLIPPGKSVTMEWVIHPTELTQWNDQSVDVTADITVVAEIRAGGKPEEFRGTDRLNIMSASGSSSEERPMDLFQTVVKEIELFIPEG